MTTSELPKQLPNCNNDCLQEALIILTFKGTQLGPHLEFSLIYKIRETAGFLQLKPIVVHNSWKRVVKGPKCARRYVCLGSRAAGWPALKRECTLGWNLLVLLPGS